MTYPLNCWLWSEVEAYAKLKHFELDSERRLFNGKRSLHSVKRHTLRRKQQSHFQAHHLTTYNFNSSHVHQNGKQKERNEKPSKQYFQLQRFHIFFFLFRLMFIELKCNLKVKNIAKKSFDQEESSSLIEAIVNRHAYSNSERERDWAKKSLHTWSSVTLSKRPRFVWINRLM